MVTALAERVFHDRHFVVLIQQIQHIKRETELQFLIRLADSEVMPKLRVGLRERFGASSVDDAIGHEGASRGIAVDLYEVPLVLDKLDGRTRADRRPSRAKRRAGEDHLADAEGALTCQPLQVIGADHR